MIQPGPTPQNEAYAAPYTAESIWERIEQAWIQEDTWCDYRQALRLALQSKPESSQSLPLLLLPGLCCQAAGGNPNSTVGLAAAWALLYTAADILDDVEDGAIAASAAQAVNISTGLIFMAVRTLSDWQPSQVPDRVRLEIIRDFSGVVLQMCGSQHADLTEMNPSLERCWKIIEAKSGAWFALACRVGAQSAGIDAPLVECYSQFGYHLGLLLQMSDDIRGAWQPAGSRSDLSAGKRTLPIAYALTVTPAESRERLRQSLQAASQDRAAELVARTLIEATGARLYLSIEAHRHYCQAEAALRAAEPAVAARDQLLDLLQRITLP